MKLDADATQRPTRESQAHTFVVTGMAYAIDEADLGRFPTLAELVQAWTQQTRAARSRGGDVVYIDFTRQPEFTYVSSSVSADDSIGADCVRYESEFEERGNRNVPRGWVLAIRLYGIACRHPEAHDVLIDLSFSERARQGAPNPDPDAWGALLAGAQTTLSSLQFESLARPAAASPTITLTRGMPLPPEGLAAGTLGPDDPEFPDHSSFETWHFEAGAGERVRIRMESDSFDAALALVRLTDGDFELLASSVEGRDARIDYRAPIDGEYVLIASSYRPQASGAYTIELERR
jgi:hypothetical protein